MPPPTCGCVLCSGKITPDGALLFSSCIYIAVLIVACTLPDTMLRLIIAMSAVATLAYTPILKRITAMKNLTVAFIIATSPLTGALATGLVRATPLPFPLPFHCRHCAVRPCSCTLANPA